MTECFSFQAWVRAGLISTKRMPHVTNFCRSLTIWPNLQQNSLTRVAEVASVKIRPNCSRSHLFSRLLILVLVTRNRAVVLRPPWQNPGSAPEIYQCPPSQIWEAIWLEWLPTDKHADHSLDCMIAWSWLISISVFCQMREVCLKNIQHRFFVSFYHGKKFVT